MCAGVDSSSPDVSGQAMPLQWHWLWRPVGLLTLHAKNWFKAVALQIQAGRVHLRELVQIARGEI